MESESEVYAREMREALNRTPERAARLDELERAVGAAETREEVRAAGWQLHILLDEAAAEVNAVRRAEGRLVPRSGCRCGQSD
jgi:hypothetical protein